MKSVSKKPSGAHRKPAQSATKARVSEAKSRSSVDNSQVSPMKHAEGVQWTFLTNHSHVLVLLDRNPSQVLREVALQVGITERAVQRIIADLEAGGIIEREKIGRQNHYRIQANRSLRHPIEAHRTIGDLLSLLSDKSS